MGFVKKIEFYEFYKPCELFCLKPYFLLYAKEKLIWGMPLRILPYVYVHSSL